MAGRVTDVEGVPGNPKVFYVATATGGIWKTINAGTMFVPLFDKERVISMGDIALAPSNPSIIYAGTGEEDSRNSISPGGGLYKSTDAGRTWKLMGLEATQQIGRIIVVEKIFNTPGIGPYLVDAAFNRVAKVPVARRDDAHVRLLESRPAKALIFAFLDET